jgi:hypothetical protein
MWLSNFFCRPISFSRRDCALVCALLAALLSLAVNQAHAKEPPRKKSELPGPREVPQKQRPAIARTAAEFRSKHFLLHTDLPQKEARELLHKLEVMVGLISKYWGQPAAGMIECYVVENLANWPAGSLNAAGRAKIQQRAGITMVETMSRGAKLLSAKALVFATAEHGTPQHEAVHAYCGQTFGRTGPLWYAEGMAEVGQYWREGDTGVHVPDHVLGYLRESRRRSIDEIIADDGTNASNPSGAAADSWQNYAWRWALCHLLVNNPNYAGRFRGLGLTFLNGGPAKFADVFGPMHDEIAFEFGLFLSHLEEGYRVDLCSWDWKRKSRELVDATPVHARVAANHGWQPCGAIVEAGKYYDFSASGNWSIGKDEPATADGGSDGRGRLEGVVFKDFALGEPFALGSYGSFVAPGDGRLYLRCRDDWNSLADNKGSLSITIKNADRGGPLPKPKQGELETADAK